MIQKNGINDSLMHDPVSFTIRNDTSRVRTIKIQCQQKGIKEEKSSQHAFHRIVNNKKWIILMLLGN